MENLTFETLRQGWHAIIASGAHNLRTAVSGFIEPSRILIQRVGETPEIITILFKGFDQALDNPEQDAPILKSAILAWVKKFAEAQIEGRGDPHNFIIRVIKPQPTIPERTAQQPAAPDMNSPLARISNVRTTHGR